MIYIELDFAIYKRLVGYPLDAQGRPRLDPNTGVPANQEVIGPPDLYPVQFTVDPINGVQTPIYPFMPSYGIRIPMMKPPYRGQRGLTSKDPAALPRILTDRFEPNTFRQIPVFDENITGIQYEDIWPCVTFRWRNTEYEPRTFVYHDPFGAPNSDSFQDPTSGVVTITNSNNLSISSGYSQNVVRPHPESWNVYYSITAWAKEQIELGLICNEIQKLFPGKGAIVITFQDGSTHACDMLLQRVETLDDFGEQVLRTQGGEEQRGFSRSFVYLIEGYIDNTTNQFGIQNSEWSTRSNPAILERLVEIDNVMNNMVQTQLHDLNLDELSPYNPIPGA